MNKQGIVCMRQGPCNNLSRLVTTRFGPYHEGGRTLYIRSLFLSLVYWCLYVLFKIVSIPDFYPSCTSINSYIIHPNCISTLLSSFHFLLLLNEPPTSNPTRQGLSVTGSRLRGPILPTSLVRSRRSYLTPTRSVSPVILLPVVPVQ